MWQVRKKTLCRILYICGTSKCDGTPKNDMTLKSGGHAKPRWSVPNFDWCEAPNPNDITCQSEMVHTQTPKSGGVTHKSAIVHINAPTCDGGQVFSTSRFSLLLTWRNKIVSVWRSFVSKLLFILFHNNVMLHTLITHAITVWCLRPSHFGVAFLYRIYRRGTIAL